MDSRAHRIVPSGPARSRRRPRLSRGAARLERFVLACAETPLRTLALVATVNLAAAACCLSLGSVLGDRALFFRELAPATLLSFGQLLLIAATAHAAHRLAAPGRPVWRTFWGLASCVFLVFAFDEITQAMIFLSALLESAFALAPSGGFNDLEAVLLTLMFAAAALLLAPRMAAVLRQPLAASLLAVGVLVGAASQALDSFAAATSWEFVAEETLKLGAEVFLLGGFLCALAGLRGQGGALEPAQDRAGE